ncbi:MAG: pyrroline-5-carboxylate reductase [Thaumarchaeota archaeon]|nr:pyrroline-5-carboxylate reductase [Nitrososphaerota archaeon]
MASAEQKKIASRKKVVAILGAGKMGEALARGVLRAGLASQVIATDVLESRLEAMKKIGVKTMKSNADAAKASDMVLLSVKPKDMAHVLDGISTAIGDKRLVISIAAGVPLSFIEQHLKKAKVVRAMPNIAATVQEAITALAPGTNASPEDLEAAKALFTSVGRCIVVDEKLMDAITALSGSGPGYIFAIIEGLTDGGVKTGLPYDIALQLAAQTVLGASKMVLEAGKHPAELRSMVATPAGTTIEGLAIIEESGLRGTLIRAVEAATRRGKEISQSLFS